MANHFVPQTSIIAELVLSPRSTDNISLSQPLKEALSILHKIPHLEIKTHAMGTNIACNDLNLLLDAVKQVHNFLFTRGFPRVVTTLKIDERRDKPNRKLEDKIKSIS